MDNEIDGKEFIKARQLEIENLINKISPSKKKKMLFQRLPYYKRRRLKSYKKVKKKKKSSSENFFAKRFSMIKINEREVAYKRRLKSDKFIYKSLKLQKRGFFMDISFRDIFINKNCCVIGPSCLELGFDCHHLSGEKIYLDSHYLIYMFNSDLKDGIYIIKNNQLVFENDFNAPDSLSYLKIYLESGTIDYKNENTNEDKNLKIKNKNEPEFKNYTSQKTKTEINNILKSVNHAEKINLNLKNLKNDLFYEKIFIFNCNNQEKIILSPKKLTVTFYQNLISRGYIPIGIHDYLRITLELSKITIFDTLNSLYRQFENEITAPLIEKYKRTPKGKKINYEIFKIQNPFIIPDFDGCVYYFESNQVFMRCAVIYKIDIEEYNKLCLDFKKSTIKKIREEYSGIIKNENIFYKVDNKDDNNYQINNKDDNNYQINNKDDNNYQINNNDDIKNNNNNDFDYQNKILSLKYNEKTYKTELGEYISAYLFEQNNIVGYVLRGKFCFSIGKGRGICILNYNDNSFYFARNINSQKSSRISIIKKYSYAL
ncbi:hypothetical protein DMUE_2108 [Dictyocoela muelleri]|nr:hypothetical protein DMUE_2108 [Dictyocoela muelleri]